MRSNYWRATFAIFGTLILTQCSDVGRPLNESQMKLEAPFGYSWSLDGEDHKVLKEKSFQECMDDPPKDVPIVETGVEEYCRFLTRSPISLFVPIEDDALEGAGLQLSWAPGNGLAIIQYSYLHASHPQNPAEMTKLRRRHAAGIRRVLKQLYGAPAARGYFDHSSITGFVRTHLPFSPCSVWLEGLVVIELCAERIVIVDGTEMSLKFFRLDRVPYGVSYLEMISPMRVSEDEYQPVHEGRTSFERQAKVRKARSFLETLKRAQTAQHSADCEKAAYLSHQDWGGHLSLTSDPEIVQVLEEGEAEEIADFAYKLGGNTQLEYDQIEKAAITRALILEAYERGATSTLNEIGSAYLYCFPELKQDLKLAEDFLMQGAAREDNRAIYNLGIMHLAGIARDSDAGQGEEYLQTCAEQGYEPCIVELDQYHLLKEAGEIH